MQNKKCEKQWNHRKNKNRLPAWLKPEGGKNREGVKRMQINNIMKSEILQGIKANVRSFFAFVAGAIHKIYERIRANRKVCWVIALGTKYMLVVLVLIAWTIVAARFGQKKAIAQYEVWMEEYKIEQAEAAQMAVENDPYIIQLNAEAEMLARVLYGVKNNKTDDLKTYCWCVFNRVDNSHYPDTLEDVIAQPQQWMRYDPTNPVLENLYQIAREQLDAWHTDSHRPVDSSYVFMNWSSRDIVLRDQWAEGAGCHYWRWSQ